MQVCGLAGLVSWTGDVSAGIDGGLVPESVLNDLASNRAIASDMLLYTNKRFATPYYLATIAVCGLLLAALHMCVSAWQTVFSPMVAQQRIGQATTSSSGEGTGTYDMHGGAAYDVANGGDSDRSRLQGQELEAVQSEGATEGDAYRMPMWMAPQSQAPHDIEVGRGYAINSRPSAPQAAGTDVDDSGYTINSSNA